MKHTLPIGKTRLVNIFFLDFDTTHEPIKINNGSFDGFVVQLRFSNSAVTPCYPVGPMDAVLHLLRAGNLSYTAPTELDSDGVSQHPWC